ncbi:MAG TPA: hypothetical protein VHO25_17405 [Polyangiaceae bacterium]|nr:hypothetical protein [Polyangiaceae bacterium]
MVASSLDPFEEVLERACVAVNAACIDGLQPDTADANFERTWPSSALRAIALEHKVDLGFDPGPERFATFLTLRLCRNLLQRLPNVVAAAARFSVDARSGRHNFYITPNAHPYDVDTSSVAAAGMFEANLVTSGELRQSVVELTKATFRADNVRTTKYLPIPTRADVVMVYWLDIEPPPPYFRRPQFDAAVASNVLYAASLAHDSTEFAKHFEPTWRFVKDHLISGRYLEGTLYYPSPDSFLCLFGLLLARVPQQLDQDVTTAFVRAILQRATIAADNLVKDPGSPLNQAQRIIAADAINLAANEEIVAGVPAMKQQLAKAQQPDGLWAAVPHYGYGPLPYFIGSRELTSIYGLSALGGGALP